MRGDTSKERKEDERHNHYRPEWGRNGGNMPMKRMRAKELGVKVGDLFKCVEAIGSLYSVGDTLRFTRDDGTHTPYFDNLTTGRRNVSASFNSLERRNKSLDNLEVGDVIVDGDSEETILAVLAPGFYCMSIRNNPRVYSWTATAYTLELNGWRVKQAEPVQPREITMAEVEEKFGEPVIIKKED